MKSYPPPPSLSADIPCTSLVVLAGRDTVADAAQVRAQLVDWQLTLALRSQRSLPARRAPRMQVEYHDAYFHGQIFAHVTEQRRLINQLLGAAASAHAAEAAAAEDARLATARSHPSPPATPVEQAGRDATGTPPTAPKSAPRTMPRTMPRTVPLRRPPRSLATSGRAEEPTVDCVLANGVIRRVHMGDATKRLAPHSDEDTETASMISSCFSPSEASFTSSTSEVCDAPHAASPAYSGVAANATDYAPL